MSQTEVKSEDVQTILKWSLFLWSRDLFNWISPVQGFNPVNFDGLSGENSVTMGNKSKEFFSLPVYKFGVSGLISDTQNDKSGVSEHNFDTLNDESSL